MLLFSSELLSLMEEPLLGQWCKENIYNVTIVIQVKNMLTGLLNLIEESFLGPWNKENLITASIILQLYVIPTGLLSLIEEPLLSEWSKENTYADTIIIQNSYWISQPDIRTTFGSLKQGKELCHNNSNKRIEHSYWIPQPERSTTFGSLELGHLSSMLILEYYEETKFFWI